MNFDQWWNSEIGKYPDNSCKEVARTAWDAALATTPVERMVEALRDAAASLETIHSLAGMDEYLGDIIQIRGYAKDRADCARAALKEIDHE